MLRQFQNGFIPGPMGMGAGLIGPAAFGVLHPVPIALVRPRSFRRIAFEPVAKDQGFDPTTDPPWQMVPWSDPAKPVARANTRQVRVDLHGLDPTGLGIKSNDMNIADIKAASAGIMEITGRSPGTCFIQIFRKASGEVIAELEVTVKKPQVHTIDFFDILPEDTAGTSNRLLPGKYFTDLAKLLADVNEIIQPQTNITFKASSTITGTVVISEKLGRVISEAEARRIIAEMTRTTDVAVVFVKDYNKKNRGGDTEEAVTFHEDDTIFIDDRIGNRFGKHDATVLAHELGHWLLFNSKKPDSHEAIYGKGRNHSRNRRDLMHSTSLKGRRIRRREANVMNESGLSPRAPGRVDHDRFRKFVEDFF